MLYGPIIRHTAFCDDDKTLGCCVRLCVPPTDSPLYLHVVK